MKNLFCDFSNSTLQKLFLEQSLSSDGDDEPKAKTSEEEDEATMVKKQSSKIKIESNYKCK